MKATLFHKVFPTFTEEQLMDILREHSRESFLLNFHQRF